MTFHARLGGSIAQNTYPYAESRCFNFVFNVGRENKVGNQTEEERDLLE